MDKIIAATSIIIGVLFGSIWSRIFLDKKSPYTWSLASTSIIRYLLLAAVLAILMIKFKISIILWSVGFMTSFWVLITRKTLLNTRNKENSGKNRENSNIWARSNQTPKKFWDNPQVLGSPHWYSHIHMDLDGRSFSNHHRNTILSKTKKNKPLFLHYRADRRFLRQFMQRLIWIFQI